MENLHEQRVLVTGGTGSFGNFIVRRLLEYGTKEVRVLSRDEKKQYDMRIFYNGRKDLTFAIGDVRRIESVDEAMDGIDTVFNAAALKQIGTCESFPAEAIQTNITGAENVINSALRNQVKNFVMISTDKAVKPVNVMGMTKAIQERLTIRANHSRLNKCTRLGVVRYGNVLRSRGSVVPFFRRQLALGERLSITDEDMTRFLLTLNDAIDLVLFAAETLAGGEIFVRKAPAARILDMAAVLSEEAGVPLKYDVIGRLQGEKLEEILVSEEELTRTEDVGDYYKILPWWSKERPHALKQEFSSADYVITQDALKELIAKADKEFATMELATGELSKI